MRATVTILVAAGAAFSAPSPAASLESLLAEAHRAEARSDFAAAAASYRGAVAISPETAELWSNLGVALYAAKEYGQAGTALRTANRLRPALYAPVLFLGLDLLEQKKPGEALPWLLEAQRMQPRDPQALLALGRAYFVQRDFMKSRNWYREAAVAASQNGKAWYGLGLAYFGLAESAGSALVKSHSQSGYAADLKAQAFAEQGRLDEAAEIYRTLFASSNVPPCAHSGFGFVLMQQTKAGEAQTEFAKDAASCPAARRAFDHGASEGAFRIPEDRRNPETVKLDANALERLAADSFFAGDPQTAAEASDRLMSEHAAQASGYYWAVRADQKLAVIALTRAGEVEPDSAQLHALLGDVYRAQNRFREAEAEFNRVLQLSPGSVAGFAGLATAYLAEGKLDEARTAATEASARNPRDPDINLLLGEILVAEHQYAEAEPHLKASCTVRSDLLPRVHALLGRVYARTGRSREAIAELKQGLASDEDGSVSYQLARLYYDAGDRKDAEEAFARSRRLQAARDKEAQPVLNPAESSN